MNKSRVNNNEEILNFPKRAAQKRAFLTRTQTTTCKGRLQTEILLLIRTKMAPPKLNKDGTERKTKASKQQPTGGTSGPTKAQLEAQRNAMRETLKQLKEKRDAEDDEAFEIGSVYDLALGLELWLTDNSKVRPRLRAIRGRFLV